MGVEQDREAFACLAAVPMLAMVLAAAFAAVSLAWRVLVWLTGGAP
jgi:hypothetical protein